MVVGVFVNSMLFVLNLYVALVDEVLLQEIEILFVVLVSVCHQSSCLIYSPQ